MAKSHKNSNKIWNLGRKEFRRDQNGQPVLGPDGLPQRIILRWGNIRIEVPDAGTYTDTCITQGGEERKLTADEARRIVENHQGFSLNPPLQVADYRAAAAPAVDVEALKEQLRREILKELVEENSEPTGVGPTEKSEAPEETGLNESEIYNQDTAAPGEIPTVAAKKTARKGEN